jgi:pimeloyl-ACP methyl ester carboxylesterase
MTLWACAGTDRADDTTADLLQTREIVDGGAFRHVVIHGRVTGGAELHVYLEGDGVPAHADPTSRTALMWRLMVRDPAPSIYVGRPCYLGLSTDPSCNRHEWTDRRFSPEVIASLHHVIAAQVTSTGASRVLLIGHSGGGALAVLLAHEVPAVAGVITIAGNLDTEAWTRLHGYAPLTGSLNPVQSGRLPATVDAVHLAGSRDRVVPPRLIEAAAASIGGAVVVFDGFTHECCWQDAWPGLIALLPTFAARVDPKVVPAEP